MPSTKLSLTVGAALRAKYAAAALQRLDEAVAAWIAADAARGIDTLHLAVDDPAAMQPTGVAPLRGRVTPSKLKRVLDALCQRLVPDYVVLFGGPDVVPMFSVRNPSFDPQGDDDEDVPTDNPYACSTAFRADRRSSYLVPDRVLGRIADVPGDGDIDGLLAQLRRYRDWSPRPAGHFGEVYAPCCQVWAPSGRDALRHLGFDARELMPSPPLREASRRGRDRLSRPLHLIKCHGARLDARFYGEATAGGQPEVLHSRGLRRGLKAGTLAAAMCCYGGQLFDPQDPAAQQPGEAPIAATYLRHGAIGLAGATRIAWVGPQDMQCADWIVAGFVKACLSGASTGRALLQAKQDFLRWITVTQGWTPDTADEKTLIEFVLLGDPSLHPVRQPSGAAQPAAPRGVRSRAAGTAAAAPVASAEERRQRRRLQHELAGAIRRQLPLRFEPQPCDEANARALFELVRPMMDAADARSLDPSRATVQPLARPEYADGARASRSAGARGPSAVSPGEDGTREYYWTGREAPQRPGTPAGLRLLKVQTDAQGRVLRSRLLHGA